jgi:hypothetical protein
MRGRVAIAFDPVAGNRGDGAGRIEQNRADRHVAPFGRSRGLGESHDHWLPGHCAPPCPAYLLVAHAVLAPARSFG